MKCDFTFGLLEKKKKKICPDLPKVSMIANDQNPDVAISSLKRDKLTRKFGFASGWFFFPPLYGGGLPLISGVATKQTHETPVGTFLPLLCPEEIHSAVEGQMRDGGGEVFGAKHAKISCVKIYSGHFPASVCLRVEILTGRHPSANVPQANKAQGSDSFEVHSIFVFLFFVLLEANKQVLRNSCSFV